MDYPNSGALWPNQKRETEKHPNSTGSIKIERGLLKEMMASQDNELIEILLSGWTKEWQGKKYVSLKASKPYKKGEQQSKPPVDEDDIPF